MERVAAISAPGVCCAHCGLPVAPRHCTEGAEAYCCSACRMVARILGANTGEAGWHLLRLGFGALLGMNIMMISLLLYTGSVEPRLVPTFHLVLLAASIPALIVLLPPLVTGAYREIGTGRLSLDTLISVGSLSAFSVSALHTLRGSGAVYYDTATMLPVLVTAGKLIESSAKARAADLLHGLLALLPATALRVSLASMAEVPVDTLRPGDLIRVRPGERVAVDGRIIEGTSSIEEAAFTGEFLPRHCQAGDRVIAGTVNGAGTLLVQAERTGSELLLHGIVSLIEEAWRRPARSQRIADRAAALFIPATLLVAAASVLCWSLAGHPGQGLLSALSVLVVACPCTMGIATPLATSLAIARAARAGIVVRGGHVMERIADLNLLFFDKTGTLTSAEPVLQEIEILDASLDADEILGRLATLEAASEHLLAKTVVREAKRRGLELERASLVEVVPGYGISGIVTRRGVPRRVTAGSPGFVQPAREYRLTETAQHLSACSMIAVAFDGIPVARLWIGERLRPEARQCLRLLEGNGVDCAVLSGDRATVAEALAGQLGVTQVEAPRTPAQKLQAISYRFASGKVVGMIGDGINDAPALAGAHVGIAFAAGTELARQAGDVVLFSDRLLQIPWLLGLSKATGRIIRGNFTWSFAYNCVALCAAAAGLLHPLLAAVAMVLSSLTVLGNSLRIARYPDISDVAGTPAAPGSAAILGSPSGVDS